MPRAVLLRTIIAPLALGLIVVPTAAQRSPLENRGRPAPPPQPTASPAPPLAQSRSADPAPAPASGFTSPQRRTDSLIPVDTNAQAEPLGALSGIGYTTMPDEIGVKFWSVGREGSAAIKPGDVLTLSYLSRGVPTYKKVALQFVDDLTDTARGYGCDRLAADQDRITQLDGLIVADTSPADEKLIAAAKAKQSALYGKEPQYLVKVTAAYNGDLIAAAAQNRKLAVRAFPIAGDGTCLRPSAGAYVLALRSWKEQTVVLPTAPPPAPGVSIAVTPVGWSPAITKNCSYIISAPVKDAAWNEVLKLRNISREVGTRFTLCPTEFQMWSDSLSDATKAKIAVKNALGTLSAGFDWTAATFQSVAAIVGKPLAGLVGQDAAKIFSEALFGQLPGSPLTGDMNMVIDQGCAYAKNQVAGAIAAKANAKELSPDQRATADAAVQKACDAVRAAMQAKAQVNDFLQIDLDKEPRAALMWVRVAHVAQHGATPDMRSSDFKTMLTVRSKGGPGTIAKFGSPQTLLYEREAIIPGGAAGTSLILPFTMAYAILPNSQAFHIGATAAAGMRLNAGGYGDQDLIIHSIVQNVPPPAQ